MIYKPKISIITPCFNAVKYIEQTILSIINQEYENLEYIFIDGGSTDGTVDIIRKYEDKIAFWISEPDHGQSDAINKGISKATGDIFNWINADDYLEPRVLETIAKKYLETSFQVLCSQTNLVDNNGSFIRINPATEANWSFQKHMIYHGLNQQGMFWNMNVIRLLKGVNKDFNYSMDLDLWKRFLLTCGLKEVYQINLVTANFRLLETSKTGADFEINFKYFELENNAALIQYASCLGKKYSDVVKYLYPNYAHVLSSLNVQSDLPENNLKKWLIELFYKHAQTLFFAENFLKTYHLICLLPLNEFSAEQLKNLKSYKRWSLLKKWLQKTKS